MQATGYDDTASYPAMKNSCGNYIQKGELRFYSDADTGDLMSNNAWKANLKHGEETGCGTSPYLLISVSGRGGPPGFWKFPPIASGVRRFNLIWRCCACDPPQKRVAEADLSK